MKGVILAGGLGTRLYPVTQVVSKQLLPIFDKPMIYYPLTTLMLAGLRELLVISTPQDLPRFENLLGDGHKWGISLSYKAQSTPDGIAHALLVAEEFLAGDSCALILGDNIFYGHDIVTVIRRGMDKLGSGATVFAYRVNDPRGFGVIELDADGKALGLVEKPEKPKSKFAVVGLYLYAGNAPDRVRELERSARGEIEITDLNRIYLNEGSLSVELLGRGVAWLDTGTHQSMLDAGHFIHTIETRQGLKIACPEEVAWRNGWIDNEQLRGLAAPLLSSGYGKYLLDLVEERPGN